MASKTWDPFAYPEQIRFSSRARALARLNDIYYGKQYDDRPSWWTGKHGEGGDRKPLRERKPCRIYKLPGAAVRQVERFLWGDERWPTITVQVPEEDTEAVVRLSEDEAKMLNRWLADLTELCGLQVAVRDASDKGIAVGSVPIAIFVKNGLFSFEPLRAQDCWPRFANDDPTNEVTELVQCYEFLRDMDEGDGQPHSARFLYRRQWTPGATWMFREVELTAEGPSQKIKWSSPEAVPSGLSFVPIVWVRNGSGQQQGIDGSSLYADSEEDLQALDFSCSQRYRGIAYLGTPQPVETGVASEEDPGVRKSGPDEFWSYEGKEVNVSLLETSGKSYEVASKHVGDIRSELLEQWGVVLTNMTDTVGRMASGNEMSGRFLEIAHAPLLATISDYRDVWWRNALHPLLQMCLRSCTELGGKGLMIPNSVKVAELGKRFLVQVDGKPAPQWVGPLLKPVWGRYFPPDDAEVKTSVETAAAAKQASLASKRTLLEYIAGDLGIHDLDEELERIEEESAEAEAMEADRQAQEVEKLHALAAGQGAPRARAGADTAQGTGGGSRSPVVAKAEDQGGKQTAPESRVSTDDT